MSANKLSTNEAKPVDSPGIPGLAAKVNQLFYHSFRWGSKEWDQITALKHHTKVLDVLVECKDYIFQLEEGKEEGFIHYQGYLHLEHRAYSKVLAVHLQNLGLNGVEIRPCSNEGKSALKSYCMKKDTRLAGPWFKDPVKGRKLIRAVEDQEHIEEYKGEDLPKYEGLLPWQRSTVDMVKMKPDRRTIYWFYDKYGRAGKTMLAKFLMVYHRATLGAWSDSASMLYAVAKGVESGRGKIFVFNLTRSKPKLFSCDDLYSTLESIKDGAILSTKYDSKPLAFPPPWVLVFSNKKPSRSALSKDRIKVIQLDGVVKPPPEPEPEYDASTIGTVLKIDELSDTEEEIEELDAQGNKALGEELFRQIRK